MIPVTFAVVDDAVPAAALEGVSVRVYSADGATFITTGVTDSAGEYTADLVDGTQYWVRFYLPGYTFPSKLLFLVDSAATNIWDIVGGDIVARPPAMDPNLCRATGQVIGAAGQPVDGITFTFMMTEDPRIVGGRVVIPNNVIVRSQQRGFLQVDLIRNAIYEVGIEGIPGLELSDYTVPRFKVPDQASASFVELIWPYVVSVTPSTAAVAVTAGNTVDVAITQVLLSSGVTVPYEMDCDEEVLRSAHLSIQTSDSDIASAVWNTDETILTITGHAAGTADITLEELPLSRVPRQPALPAAVGTFTVTVT